MNRKTPAPISTRYSDDTITRLDQHAQAEGQSRSTLIQRYVAEGIEMDDFPGILFRAGPAGRRPGLVGGPDVWEVIAVFQSFDDVQRTANWLDQPITAIEAALSYYHAHRDEIDEWIKRNEEAAEAAERIALARQAAS
jgi:predicted transcriptional regulator